MSAALDRLRTADGPPPPGPELGPKPLPEPPRWAVVTGRTLLVVALVGAWCLSYVFGLSRLEESRSQHALYTRLRSEIAAGISPVSEPITSAAPIGTLNIPSIGIHDLVFVQGTTASALENGPGHLRGTPLPGQVGSSVLFGRGTSFGGPFHKIAGLQRGDAVTVTTGQGTFVYAVADVRGAGDPEPIPPTGARSLLTLVTARGSGAFGWLSPQDAVYVDAVQQKAGLPSTALALPRNANEGVLASDTSFVTRLELALTLIIVAVVVAGMVWSRRRWGGVQRWLVGAPLFAGSVWLLSDIAVRFLPNVF